MSVLRGGEIGRSRPANVIAARGDAPDAATIVWWGLTGEVSESAIEAHRRDFVTLLAESFVVGQGPTGTLDVTLEAWDRWVAAVPADGAWAESRGAGACRRIRRGDLPRAGDAHDPPTTPEARLLADTLALAARHERLTARFAEEVAAARYESCRELAYGAGHEINNPLANIATRAQTLLVGEHDPERRRRLSTIVDQAFRARDLIGGMMLFARPPRPRPSLADADALVAALLERVAAVAAPRRVTLEHRRSPHAAPVWADTAQVEEALRAVVVNAIEAVSDGGGVTVEVHSPSATEPAGTESGRTRVVVRDDGIGMDVATLRRAFDPFFSGREAGRGAGLGLSKARRFLGINGGEILLESRPGAGTRAEISLPSAPAPAAPARVAADAATA